MNPALYMPIPATIEQIADETPAIKTFTIRPREPVPFAVVFVAVPIVQLAFPRSTSVAVLATLAWEDWSTMDSVLITTSNSGGSLPRNWIALSSR